MVVTIRRAGPRVYLQNLPFQFKDLAKETLGLTYKKNFDQDSKTWWCGVAKLAKAQEFVTMLNENPPAPKAEDLDDVRLVGKATYKGRTYYVRQVTADQTRCRLITLDGKLDFWADLATDAGDVTAESAAMQKRYEPRDERGSYGQPTGRKVYTTVGSIRKFVESQRRAEAGGGLPACAGCGKRDSNLIEDLEDGLFKHRHCCDVPSE